MSRPRTRVILLFLAVSALITIALAEVALRVFARFPSSLTFRLKTSDPYAVKIEPHGNFGYRPKPGSRFGYPTGGATENAAGWRGPVVDMPKPAGTVRIILLGESTTHGWGVRDNETIDEYLRAMLNDGRGASMRYEVVNLAFDGYDAYQIWQRMVSDGVRLQPDAIILNTGINDVRNARFQGLADPDPRTLLWSGEITRLRWEAEHGGPALKTRLKHYLYLARLPGVLRQARAMAGSGPKPREHVYPDAAVEFARNVERIADEAARLGVPLLLSTPPSVLLRPGAPADMSPRSYWVIGPPETQAYRDTLSSRLVGIARDRTSRGQPVTYVPHELAPNLFLDDCHLTPEGNRRMAADFAAALAPYLRRP